MNSLGSSTKTNAFTMLEMLCVVAVVLILAALLFPALIEGNSRARRAQCVNNLKDIGVAFHVFAHDHQDRFPMQLPAAEDGSLEFVESAYQVPGEFYFSFRHFTPLSNVLTSPRVLLCPADASRTPARDFTSFNNDHLSYFVGVSSRFQKPNSILSGDRNVTNDTSSNSSVVHTRYGHPLEWTGELHRFRGNLLFSDGHAEELNEPGLARAADYADASADLFLPSTPTPGAIAVSGPRSSPVVLEENGRTHAAAGSPRANELFKGDPFGPVVVHARVVPRVESGSLTNRPATAAASTTPALPVMDAVIDRVADLLSDFSWLLYLLLALLSIGMIAMALRQRPDSGKHR